MPRSYRLGRREASVSRTHERILDAARSLFAEVGFHGVGLEEVARRADVSRKTVYYQFGSKRGLLEAVVADAERRARLAGFVDRLAEQRGRGPGEPRRLALEALWMLTSFATFDHLARRSGLPPAEVAVLLTRLAEGALHHPGGATPNP